MTKLLNRIALVLSFLMGISAALIFGLFAGIGIGYRYSNTEDLALFVMVVGAIAGVVIKYKFFSEASIRDTIIMYTDRVIQMALEKLPESTLSKTAKKSVVANEAKT